MRYAINHGREVPILLYHGVGLPDPNQDNLPLEEFRLQMRHLAEKGFHPILLSDLLDHVEGKTDLPSHPIVITFDDGVKTTYTNAFPVLKEYRFPATVFLVSDYIGEGTKWLSTLEHRWYDRDPRLNSPENDIWKFDFLSWEEVKEMGKAQVGFGSHGATHAELPRLTPKELLYELEGSKEKLETALGQKVDCFAYPWGFFNEEVKKAVQAAGYRGACAVHDREGQPLIQPDDRFAIRRILVQPYSKLEDFKTLLSSRYWLKRAGRHRLWLWAKERKLLGPYRAVKRLLFETKR